MYFHLFSYEENIKRYIYLHKYENLPNTPSPIYKPAYNKNQGPITNPTLTSSLSVKRFAQIRAILLAHTVKAMKRRIYALESQTVPTLVLNELGRSL